MVALNVILRNLAFVGLRLLGQEIHGVTLLQQGIAFVLLVPQHRGFDTSTSLHPHPINEGVKRGEARKGGETLLFSPAFLITSYVEWDTFV